MVLPINLSDGAAVPHHAQAIPPILEDIMAEMTQGHE